MQKLVKNRANAQKSSMRLNAIAMQKVVMLIMMLVIATMAFANEMTLIMGKHIINSGRKIASPTIGVHPFRRVNACHRTN